MNPRASSVITLTICLFAVVSLRSGTVQPDPSFGNNGVATLSFGPGFEIVYGVTVAPDGSLLAVGTASVPGHSDIAVARFTANGELMASRLVDLRPGETINDEGSRVAVLSDGRILIAGLTGQSHVNTKYDVALVRLLPSLELDPTFGNGGVVITPCDQFAWMKGLVVQPDGRILVGGSFGLLRYSEDGVLDDSFGNAGRVAPPVLATIGSEHVAGFDVQPDGRIVVAGTTFEPGKSELSLARYLPDGAPDPAFGGGGRVYLGEWIANPQAVAAQPDGRIVVAGIVLHPYPTDFAVWRFDSAGQLDSSFGVNGRVITDLGQWETPQAIALQPDGRIVAAGYQLTGSDRWSADFAVVRYDPDGTLDSSFGSGGTAILDLFGYDDQVNTVFIQPGRGVIVGGSASSSFALVRYAARNQPPVISTPVASRTVLWPPNHKLVDVTISYAATDDWDSAPECSLTVTSSERTDSAGDGATALDWQVVDAHHVRLRAERSGGGDGRVYTIAVRCSDSGGLDSERHVGVIVPRSQ